MNNYCNNCGYEQSYSGEIIGFYFCERCGSKMFPDGSVEYDGTRDGIAEMRDRIDAFDNVYKRRSK